MLIFVIVLLFFFPELRLLPTSGIWNSSISLGSVLFCFASRAKSLLDAFWSFVHACRFQSRPSCIFTSDAQSEERLCHPSFACVVAVHQFMSVFETLAYTASVAPAVLLHFFPSLKHTSRECVCQSLRGCSWLSTAIHADVSWPFSTLPAAVSYLFFVAVSFT